MFLNFQNIFGIPESDIAKAVFYYENIEGYAC